MDGDPKLDRVCVVDYSESSRKGWQLMAVCLDTFPPKEFENYLEMYLRTHAPDKNRFVNMLHSTVYGGERRSVSDTCQQCRC